MPPLPKKRAHKEADITPFVERWFLENWPNNYALEIKIKGKKPKPHQAVALQEVVDGKFTYKIPDMGRRNPSDVIGLKKADALVVTCEGHVCTAERLNDGEEFMFTV